MPVRWNLKRWLAVERNIYRPSQLRTLLLRKTGLEISLQAVSTLVNETPGALRLRTMQALCNTLDCKLSDFCEIYPDTDEEQQERKEEVS